MSRYRFENTISNSNLQASSVFADDNDNTDAYNSTHRYQKGPILKLGTILPSVHFDFFSHSQGKIIHNMTLSLESQEKILTRRIGT